MKISSYPENFAPEPEIFTPIEPVIHDQKYATPIGNLSVIPYRNKMNKQWTDFHGAQFSAADDQLAPFFPTAIGAGTIVAIAQEANHPGIWRISSAAGSNTGHNVGLGGVTSVLIGGGEVAEFIVRFGTISNVVARMGFHDSLGSGAPTDSVRLNLSGGAFSGICDNNSSQSSTATTFTPSANVWYRLKVEVNVAASLVTFSIYDSATDTLLWSDTVASNIPTATGRETNFTFQAFKTTTGAAVLVDLDWMAYYNTKALVR